MIRFRLTGVLMLLATVMVFAEDAAIDETPPSDVTIPIDELSQAEIDAELERVEQALGKKGEAKEFTPTRPTPADTPVALPSDI